MKIRSVEKPYSEVMKLPRAEHKRPVKPLWMLRKAMYIAGKKDLEETDFSCSFDDGSKEALREPCLILMNHSSFIDLEIAANIFSDIRFGIVCTADGFIGKEKLMRELGCIPTQKFVSDFTLVSDIRYALEKLGISVLMYPEASYTFDGCTTPLPRGLNRLVRLLKTNVIMVKTEGAFARDPLYNGLRKRKVRVSAKVSLLIPKEKIASMTPDEMDEVIDSAFDYDHFAWQRDNGIRITEDFRAEGLERILYRCPHCGTEGKTAGHEISLVCEECGKSYTMDELGVMHADDGETEFPHIPDWYAWERECVRREITEGSYLLDTDVRIAVSVDMKALYFVGNGHLTHTAAGFTLTGCDGELNYVQGPNASYGLYSDYFWYEIGDMICIGNNDTRYYCFPEKKGVVAKTRMAAEEIYRLSDKRKKRRVD